MPVIIPEDIPAYAFLKQESFIMGEQRAARQDIRPLRLLIVNLMPTKIETENQLLSLLANSPLQTEITLLSTSTYRGSNTPQSHLEQFYVDFEQIRTIRFDGAIITGAPVEHLAFEEVKYWLELREIMDYLRTRCTSTMYICWGAMAGLYHFYGINKIDFNNKLFGVFNHSISENDLLLSGISDIVKMPHSRHSGIDEAKARTNTNLKILLEGQESGICMLRDKKDIFILGHPEYAKHTLGSEYERDKAKGAKIAPPRDYFNQNGEAILSWRSDSQVIFSNWLNFSVYQDTPFVL